MPTTATQTGQTAGQSATRPFHETIAESIQACRTIAGFMELLKLVRETTIPKDHDRIITAIDEGCRNPDIYSGSLASLVERAKASLTRQKEERSKK